MEGAKTVFKTEKTDRSRVAPTTLKERCTKAALLAFLLAPMEEIKAVTQVPIFCPIMMGTAAL